MWTPAGDRYKSSMQPLSLFYTQQFSQHSYFTVWYHKKQDLILFINPSKAPHWHPYNATWNDTIAFWCTLILTHVKQKHTYFLPCHQQVLVDVGAQEACIAVTFHQLVDVVLNEQRRWSIHRVRNKRRRGLNVCRIEREHSSFQYRSVLMMCESCSGNWDSKLEKAVTEGAGWLRLTANYYNWQEKWFHYLTLPS